MNLNQIIALLLCIILIWIMALLTMIVLSGPYNEYLQKKQAAKDAEWINYMADMIVNATNDKLTELDIEFYDGMSLDSKLGTPIRPIEKQIYKMIEEEMHKRHLETQEDIEEKAFFSQRGCINV